MSADTKTTIRRLNRHLADALLLAEEAKFWHWTVYGPTFAQLHALFDAQAEAARKGADVLAERVVQLGGVPVTPGELVEVAQVKVPSRGSVPSSQDMLQHLAANLALVREAIRPEIAETDPVTADILTEWVREVEKNHWMVTASLSR